jgi:tetratricopeptide (TPR) repeat protein
MYGPVLPPPGAPRPETEDPARRAGRLVKRPVSLDRRKLLQEGWEMYRAQRFEEARTAFDKLVAQPRAPGSAYLGLAKVAFQKGKYEEAAKWSRQGARASAGPTAVDAWLLLGDALYRLNQHKEAQAAYNEAVRRDPTNETARRMLERAERKLR